jgi:hypothetical protein
MPDSAKRAPSRWVWMKVRSAFSASSPTAGSAADEGTISIVGADNTYYVNTHFAWDFLKRFSR